MENNVKGDVKYEEEYILNSRGVKLFTCRWLPAAANNERRKALIFLCHGYAMDCSISMKGCASRLVEAGYEVHGIDCEGHGKSSGLFGLITNFDNLVDDLSQHFTNVSERKENTNKKRILMGESMGGAMIIRLHMKKPEYWNGAILVAPMCKIAEELKPNPLVTKVLTPLLRIIPSWKLTPSPDVIDIAFRDPQIRQEVRSNEYAYKGRPRLQTAHQLFITSIALEKRLEEVCLPFIVLHGEDDKVTDPNCSKLLYETARAADKTLKLYPGMWHSLSYGEFPENLEIVFSDILKWLEERASNAGLIEEQLKRVNDRLDQQPDAKQTS